MTTIHIDTFNDSFLGDLLFTLADSLDSTTVYLRSLEEVEDREAGDGENFIEKRLGYGRPAS